jgi:hypothetical protein
MFLSKQVEFEQKIGLINYKRDWKINLTVTTKLNDATIFFRENEIHKIILIQRIVKKVIRYETYSTFEN